MCALPASTCSRLRRRARARASRSSFPTCSPTGEPFSSSIPRARTPGSRPPTGARARPENGTSSIPGARSIAAMDRWREWRSKIDCEIQPALDSRSRIGRLCRRSRLSGGCPHHHREHKGPVLGRYRPRVVGWPHGVCRRASGIRSRRSLGLARKLLMKSNEELQRTIRKTAIGLGPDSVAAQKLAQFERTPKQIDHVRDLTARTQTAFWIARSSEAEHGEFGFQL
jgi:hypothetical protein